MQKIMMLGTHINTMGGIASVIRDYLEYGILTRLNITYYPTHKDGSKLTKIFFFITQFFIIVCKMPFFSIVHFHSSHGWSYRRLFTLFVIAKCFGKKTVLHIHGSQFDLYYQNACALEKYLINFGLARADKVIALSTAWKNKLLEFESSASIEIIRNGVNVDKYRIDTRQLHDPVTVLFLGRLGQRKGIYDILQAIEMLAAKNIHFILAGDGDLDQVRTIVEQKSLQNIVDIPGWISGDEKITLLKKSDIYILPSYQEGLPISILEAMAASLPIISTPVGGIPDAVFEGENGFLITPGDVAALAARIDQLSQDYQLWQKLSQGAFRIANDQYNMSRIESELTHLYKDLK